MQVACERSWNVALTSMKQVGAGMTCVAMCLVLAVVVDTAVMSLVRLGRLYENERDVMFSCKPVPYDAGRTPERPVG